ncbi:MAG: immunoglobulin domain-containing protein [Verrucomicrobiota bacterium]
MKTKLKSWTTIWLLGFSGLSSLAQGATEAWVQRYSHVSDVNDFAQKVVVDAGGNVIVAGYTVTGVTGEDWLIIKYTGAGLPMWTNRYNGPGNNTDKANAVEVGTNGNVYVTGFSTGANSLPDFTTIAYSGAGLPLWTNRYNNAAVNSSAIANALVLGTNGNVYVTGYSASDYATIAYTEVGVPLWTNRYNGPGAATDVATAMAVGANGNLYVTGYSAGTNSYDYATVAYSLAGLPLWTNRYNGPNIGYDRANAVTVGTNGTVYVTGNSYGQNSNPDYATIAYSDGGVPIWTNRYNGAGNGEDQANAIVVGYNDTVYVTGYSYSSSSGFSSYDYITIAYSGAGVPQWTNRYNGPVNSHDHANALAVGMNGNVYVTGHSFGNGSSYDYATIAYSGGGTPLWTNRYNGRGNGEDRASAVAVGANGAVYVTGYSIGVGTSFDFAAIAYSGAGLPQWTNRHNELGNYDDYVTAVAVGTNGNVFVAGYSQSSSGSSYTDYAILAYSGAGLVLWTNRYNGLANSHDRANAVGVGPNGNVYVTGGSGSTNANPYNYDYATVAYTSLGVPLWTNRYNGPGNNEDIVKAMVVGPDGTVYVTGLSLGSGSSYDYATIAYSGVGIPLWTNRYIGPVVNGHDSARSIAMGSNGNVLVTGSSVGVGSSDDFATIAYSRAGVPLWTNRYNGPWNGSDSANAVAIGADGSVYVTGYVHGSGNTRDYATVAYSAVGATLWANFYGGSGSGEDQANAVAVGMNGNVYVTGHSLGNGSSYDYATIAYSGGGTPLWTNRYNGTGNHIDYAKAVAVGADGTVYVVGYSFGGSSYDYVTIAYTGAGAPLWTNRYNGPANGDDLVQNQYSLAIAPDGVVVAGYSDGDYTSGAINDFAVIKYTTSVPSITSQPSNQVVAANSSVTLSVAAIGTEPLRYQWLFGGGVLINATNSSLTLSNVTFANQGGYSVIITNDYGSVTSSVAVLTVEYPLGYNILTAQWLGVAGVGFQFVGLPGGSYALERTHDLTPPASWIPLWTNLADGGGLLVFTNQPVVFTNNFWRIRSVP